jgi:catechol 2,3-dioxygenase-like lactoylglutathione lyase family enzyme
MKMQRIDHVGVIVDNLPAAKAFFLDFGLDVQWEGELEGAWLDRIVGLNGVRTEAVMVALPDGQANLELIKFHTPSDDQGIPPQPANTLGIRHIAFVVDDIEAIVSSLKRKGMETVGVIQNYENAYKLCFVRGPEGIILELAEQIA